MRILYVSRHEILEYDEVRLLTELGHQVFPLGHYHMPGPYPGGLRPQLDLGPEHAELQHRFQESGSHFDFYGPPDASFLAPEFVALFDLTIVMFDWPFINTQHKALFQRPVVLRTIGQGLHEWEGVYTALRQQGVIILRYAEAEADQLGYAGGDATIRFYKNPDDFLPYRGGQPSVLSFASNFDLRYPEEYALWQASVSGLPVKLGGQGNEAEPNAIGPVTPREQIELLADCRAYFYCSGLNLPYSLNFMEAWMAGIPVVLMSDELTPRPVRCSEIARVITPGEDALVVHSAAEANDALFRLLSDPALGRRIGQAGRRSAIAHFGRQQIGRQWEQFLERFEPRTAS